VRTTKFQITDHTYCRRKHNWK